MMQQAIRPTRGAVSRADLLRVLSVAHVDALSLWSVEERSGLGYVRVGAPTREDEFVLPISAPGDESSTESAERPKGMTPLQMPFVYCVVARESLGQTEPAAAAPELATESRTFESNQTRWPSAGPAHHPLVPQARLLPGLRRALGSCRHGGLDLQLLTRQLAGCDLRGQLPRQLVQRWHPQITVLFDVSTRLCPYHTDMELLKQALIRSCGPGLGAWKVASGPLSEATPWPATRRSGSGRERLRWNLAGSLVLIVGDLGLLRGAHSESAAEWRQLIQRLQRSRLQVIALVPLGAEQLDVSFTKLLPVLRWSPDARFTRAVGRSMSDHQPAALRELLTMLTCARRVDPVLLRALRRLHSSTPNDAGLEGAVWCHEHVDAGMTACLRLEGRAEYLKNLAESPELRPQVIRANATRRTYHSHFDAALECEETLLFDAHASEWHSDEVSVAKSRRFLRDLATAAHEVAFRDQALQIARGILHRADESMLKRFREDFSLIKQVLDRSMLGAAQRWHLVCDIWAAEIRLQRESAGAGQFAIALPLHAGGVGILTVTSEDDEVSTRMVTANESPHTLARLHQKRIVKITTATEHLTLSPIMRPRGLHQWSCKSDGISIQAVSPFGDVLSFKNPWWQSILPDNENLEAATQYAGRFEAVLDDDQSTEQWRFSATTSRDAIIFVKRSLPSFVKSADLMVGVDQFGLYAELSIRSQHGSARQRFRHIEPGVFWMGSSEDEPRHFSNEAPRHLVSLTQSFWMADTACTQDLWMAVMGTNPSYFKGRRLPVENVSWHDCQAFLQILENISHGGYLSKRRLRIELPTEAEWEYACRAGTQTPYSFGEDPSRAELNHTSDHSTAGGGTIPVASLPANAWGLFEMHGNVLEWCADGMRRYTGAKVENPVGPMQENLRNHVARGGCWLNPAWWARSAFRLQLDSTTRIDRAGFRFCLRPNVDTYSHWS